MSIAESLPKRSPRTVSPRQTRVGAAAPSPSTDPVHDYLDQIGRYPLLTADEEVSLARAIEVGLVAENRLSTNADLDPGLTRDLRVIAAEGRAAHRRFVCCNLRLVISVAKRYSSQDGSFMDTIQEGNLGLDRAVRKFDYRQGFKFSTYAVWWIRQAIVRAHAETSQLIRIPAHTMEKITKLRRIRNEFVARVGRDATPQEIASEARLDSAEVVRLLAFGRDPVSIHSLAADGSNAEIGDLIEDVDEISIDDIVVTALRSLEIRRRVDLLPSREATIVKLRFGLESEPLKRSQVAEHFGLSGERIRQLEAKALNMLRCPELQGLCDG